MWTSLAISPSIRRLTGIPVQAPTISAMSSAVTSSFSIEPGPWSVARVASSSASRSVSSLSVPYLSCAAVA